MKILGKYLKNKENLAFVLILLVFIIFTSYLALNIKQGISPDENYHVSVSSAYSKTFLIPENTEETYQYSDITRIPYLNYWINARAINLNFIGVSDLVILRSLNIFYSVLTIVFTYLISKLVINKRYFNLIPSFLLTNTLMFAFLSAAVSYDNLVNLLSVLSIYFLVKYIKQDDFKNVLLVLIVLCLGILTKFTIMPLAFIEVLIIVYLLFKRKALNSVFKDLTTKYKYYLIPLLVVLLLGILLYGVNVIKYHGLTVSCTNILTEEQCMNNGIYVRGLSLESIEINSISDLYSVLQQRLTPFDYVSDWIVAMAQRTYGIMGHESMYMPKLLTNVYIFIFLANIFLLIRKWRKKDEVESYLVIIFLFYTMVLLVFQNYKTYLHRNIFVLALQGRYIFPVISVFYILQVRYLLSIKNRLLRRIWILFMLIVFLAGCIPFFMYFLPEGWLTI